MSHKTNVTNIIVNADIELKAAINCKKCNETIYTKLNNQSDTCSNCQSKHSDRDIIEYIHNEVDSIETNNDKNTGIDIIDMDLTVRMIQGGTLWINKSSSMKEYNDACNRIIERLNSIGDDWEADLIDYYPTSKQYNYQIDLDADSIILRELVSLMEQHIDNNDVYIHLNERSPNSILYKREFEDMSNLSIQIFNSGSVVIQGTEDKTIVDKIISDLVTKIIEPNKQKITPKNSIDIDIDSDQLNRLKNQFDC